MSYVFSSSLAQAGVSEPGLSMQSLIEAIPTDGASVFTLALTALAVGWVVWSGIRSNGTPRPH